MCGAWRSGAVVMVASALACRTPAAPPPECIRPGTYHLTLAPVPWQCEGELADGAAPVPDLASAGFDLDIDTCTVEVTVRDPVGAMTLTDVRLRPAGDEVVGSIGSARRVWFVSGQRPRLAPATEAQLQGSLATVGADGPTVTVHRSVSCTAERIDVRGRRTGPP